MRKEKLIIGRKDIIDLPEFHLTNVPVKIDTGAYTSAIHCSKIEVIEENGIKTLSFYIPDLTGEADRKTRFVTAEFEQKHIKSSSGHKELRYVIKTRLRIFNKIFKTEFSLADRNSMKFPILLGRKLLRKRFVVDVSKLNLSYKSKILPNL